MPHPLECRRCPRLYGFLDQVRRDYPGYHALPVSSFGRAASRFLIVGLAPGMYGANRTGRPFTGDHAGLLLYGTLHKYGFASHPEPLDAEGNANPALNLQDCRITNAVRCLPPQNKPEPGEIRACNGYLMDELAMLPQGAAVLALGAIAHQAVLMALQLRKNSFAFAHGARHVLPGGLTDMAQAPPPNMKVLAPVVSPTLTLPRRKREQTNAVATSKIMLFDSYHCSRYNTQTKRLTTPMFEAVIANIAEYIG